MPMPLHLKDKVPVTIRKIKSMQQPFGRSYEPYGETILSSHLPGKKEARSRFEGISPLLISRTVRGYYPRQHILQPVSLSRDTFGCKVEHFQYQLNIRHGTIHKLPKFALMQDSNTNLSSSIFPASRSDFNFLRTFLIK